MKKSIIASGAASLALAAMPVVGVFADVSNSMTDNIEVTVPASCSITNAATNPNAPSSNITNEYTKRVSNGQYVTIGSDDAASGSYNTMGITCNTQEGTDAGWRLTAIGAGTTGHIAELYSAALGEGIASAATPVTTAGGSTSDWSFKVSQTGNAATPADGFSFGTFTQVPSTEKNLATGTGSTQSAAFSMGYGVYVSGTQKAGTYEGAVKYTLYNPAS